MVEHYVKNATIKQSQIEFIVTMCKTDLDDIFVQEYNGQDMNDYANAATPSIFKQDTATNAAVQMEIMKGTGKWGNRQEEQDVQSSTPRFDNKVTYSIKNFADSVDIPKNFFDDNMHGAYSSAIKEFADMAGVTRDSFAMNFYVDGFATNTTADSSYIFANDHTTLSGATVDNLATAALAPTSLNAAIVALGEQKNQAGFVRGSIAKTLLVPLTNYKNAVELTEAMLRPNTANNEPNMFSAKYNLQVATSPYLGATDSGVSGADAYWYLLANNHGMTRYVRQSVETDLVDYKFQRNNVYIYKGEFREIIGCPDYVGTYGSNGTT